MKKGAARTSLYLLLGVLTLGPRATAGEIWEKTVYFAENFAPDTKVPTPDPSWRIYSKKVISSGENVQGIEALDGSDRGTAFWLVGGSVVSIQKNGDVSVYPKNLGEASLWDSPLADLEWIKNLEPTKKIKQNGVEILLYETGGGFKRLWVMADTLVPIAQVEGKFVTRFVKLKESVAVSPPADVTKALQDSQNAERKLSEFGSMPR